jgi:hypothetical protein
MRAHLDVRVSDINSLLHLRLNLRQLVAKRRRQRQRERSVHRRRTPVELDDERSETVVSSFADGFEDGVNEGEDVIGGLDGTFEEGGVLLFGEGGSRVNGHRVVGHFDEEVRGRLKGLQGVREGWESALLLLYPLSLSPGLLLPLLQRTRRSRGAAMGGRGNEIGRTGRSGGVLRR